MAIFSTPFFCSFFDGFRPIFRIGYCLLGLGTLLHG
jgi:hypothetical protein